MINVPQNQQFLDLLHAISKEAMANMIKTAIRQQFSEPLASQYCRQFDEFKKVVDLLEIRAKQNGRWFLIDKNFHFWETDDLKTIRYEQSDISFSCVVSR